MQNKREKGKHLSLAERVEIYRLLKSGCSVRNIAKQISRNHSVVSREIKRNSLRFSTEYNPVKAEQKYQKRSLLQRQQALLRIQKYFYTLEKSLDQINGLQSK